MSTPLSIRDLSARSGVNVRTIRYYIAEGLIPPPEGRGSGATYGRGHLERLLLIARLQDAHQPLATIRSQLEELDDAEVHAALQIHKSRRAAEHSDSARDYVHRVLAGLHDTTSPEPEQRKRRSPARAKAAPSTARSNWERITLHPDIELHVRRPLARAQQRRLDELIAEAERLFPPSS